MSAADPGQAFTGRFDEATRGILPAAWATHAHLVRHGDVLELSERVVRGQMDVPLSPRGVAQHARLVEALAACEPRPAVVWTSDIERCRLLATELARALGVPLRTDARLREQSMGAWEGRTWAAITAAEPAAVRAYWDDYHEARPTHGESFADMERRALAWWHEALEAQRGASFVAVTHIGVLRAVLCRVLGVPSTQALRFAPPVGSHTRVVVSEAGGVVEHLGERPWILDGASSGRARAGASAREPTHAGAGAQQPARAGEARGPARIALSGSAGTGKTTLGRALAQELDLPFLEEGMRGRIERGFRPHGYGAREWALLIRELWEEQRAAEARAGAFVADRSSLDYAAFWLHYGLHEEAGATEDFLREMAGHARSYQRIVLLPWGVLPLEDDGVRSTNRWTQLRYQSLLEGLLERFAPPCVLRLPGGADLERRVATVRAALRA